MRENAKEQEENPKIRNKGRNQGERERERGKTREIQERVR